MKVIFCGLGSIGRRHLKNLFTVCQELGLPLEVHALRNSDRALSDDVKGLVHKVLLDVSELDTQYDITFITNPTVLHYETINLMLDRSKHMFIEKPLFDTADYTLEQLTWREGSVYYVAAPLRYTGLVQALEGIVKQETVYSVRVICSSYLPDWRPNVDYRTVYSAKRSEGGGVRTDLIHEWDYITHLFGFPERVHSLSGTYSDLEIDSEDIAVYIASYKDKLVELHLDYIGRAPQRRIELFTRDRLITADLITKTIHYSDNKGIIDFSTNEDMYVREMRHFLRMTLDCANQSPEAHLSHIQHAYEVLKLSTGRQTE